MKSLKNNVNLILLEYISVHLKVELYRRFTTNHRFKVQDHGRL